MNEKSRPSAHARSFSARPRQRAHRATSTRITSTGSNHNNPLNMIRRYRQKCTEYTITTEDIISSQAFQIGSYPANGGPGLGFGRIDTETGRPTIESWSTDVAEPSWLTVEGRTVYAVSELEPEGRITALRLADDQPPTVLNTVTTGAKPAHLTVHPSGGFLFTSLYGSGAVAVHRIEPDGTIGPETDLLVHKPEAHAHQVAIAPDGVTILAVDLGTDTVYGYRLDPETGRLEETGRTGFAAGSGPRHLAFHPSGRYAYVVHELDSTVTVCTWADATLTAGPVCSTLDQPGGPNYPGEILVSADGRFVYVSNRGANTIAVFAVEDDGARLTLLATPSCAGDWPRHLAIDRTGHWLYVANERSGEVVWFPLDPATGLPGGTAGRLPVPAVTQFNLV
jgi:6-phosphogluconolactonase